MLKLNLDTLKTSANTASNRYFNAFGGSIHNESLANSTSSDESLENDSSVSSDSSYQNDDSKTDDSCVAHDVD